VEKILVTALIVVLLAACSRGEPSPAPGSSVETVGSTAAARGVAAAPGDDGANANKPSLAPDDANFADARRGWGWSDRCFNEINQAKWGWARAACDRGLALPSIDPNARPALLYNEGLISKVAGDLAGARAYFQESLTLREPTDPGRAVVARELESVGGAIPSRTFACGQTRCAAGQWCCLDTRCVAQAGGDTCEGVEDLRNCDAVTGEPCAAPQRCKQIRWSPTIIGFQCGD
jgi:hypothetical protein